mgnify:CR=1 FL=1
MDSRIHTLAYPHRILFGSGAMRTGLKQLPPGVKKVLIVTGAHAAGGELPALIREELKGMDLFFRKGVHPEPTPMEVNEIMDIGRNAGAEAVIALGGGSVIDAAKAAAALIPAEGNCSEYFSGQRAIREKGLFFAALPTTAGTGAEMTNNSVLTDPETRVKKSLRSPFMTADLAVIDPDLTLSCPPEQTAASGLDAFVQAVESYTSLNATCATRPLAAEAAKKIFMNIQGACRHPDELDFRREMAEGSMLSALSFSQSGLGAVHGLAHPLGSLLQVPHGVACAILMPYIFQWNMPRCEREYAELACICGFGGRPLPEVVRGMAEELGIPRNFSGYGLQEKHFDFIIANCRSNSMSLNPRPMTDGDVRTLLESLC